MSNLEGKLIAIEGCDRVGKHTQSVLLRDKLEAEGYRVLLLSFPNYGSPQAKPVEMFLQGELMNLTPMEIALLYILDMSVTFREYRAKEFMESGGVVVCDRWVTSNLIYQIARIPEAIPNDPATVGGSEERAKMSVKINSIAYRTLGLPREDMVIYLNMSDDLNNRLLSEEPPEDINEGNLLFLNNVRVMGKLIAERDNWVTIECDDKRALFEREVIHNKIWEAILNRLHIE